MDIELLAKRELEQVLKMAKIKGNVTKDGVYVMNELKRRGWVAKSYAKTGHSKLSYNCGYGGDYNFSKMVKKRQCEKADVN